MEAIMPNDTLYITIARDPVALFESMFDYYHLNRFLNISFNIFENQTDFKLPTKLLKERYVGRIGLDQMVFDLGLDRPQYKKAENIDFFIRRMDSMFDLIMIAERMEESLILLKNLLCWDYDDVVALKVRDLI